MAFLIIFGLAVFLVFFIRGALEKDTNGMRQASVAPSDRARTGLLDLVLPEAYFQGLKKEFLLSRGRLGVVGERYYEDSIRQLVDSAQIGVVGDWASGLAVSVRMVREPDNPHDSNAVALYAERGLSWYKIGYIRADVAPVWGFLVQRMAEEGLAAICLGNIYRDHRGGFQGVLHVPGPEDSLPFNSFPNDALRLAAERQATVMGSRHFSESVSKLETGGYWATLHRGIMPSGKFKGAPTLDIRIDGEQVGHLSHAQGSRYLRVLRLGQVVVSEAFVSHGAANPVSVFMPKIN